MHVHNVIHSDSRAPCCLHNTSRDLSSYWSARLLSNFSLLVRRMVVIAQSLDLTNPTRSQNQTKERRIVGSFPRFSVLFELFENPAPSTPHKTSGFFSTLHVDVCDLSIRSRKSIGCVLTVCWRGARPASSFVVYVCASGSSNFLSFNLLCTAFCQIRRPYTSDPIDQSVEKGRGQKK